MRRFGYRLGEDLRTVAWDWRRPLGAPQTVAAIDDALELPTAGPGVVVRRPRRRRAGAARGARSTSGARAANRGRGRPWRSVGRRARAVAAARRAARPIHRSTRRRRAPSSRTPGRSTSCCRAPTRPPRPPAASPDPPSTSTAPSPRRSPRTPGSAPARRQHRCAGAPIAPPSRRSPRRRRTPLGRGNPGLEPRRLGAADPAVGPPRGARPALRRDHARRRRRRPEHLRGRPDGRRSAHAVSSPRRFHAGASRHALA